MLKKKFPLAISRGISGDNHNVFIKIEDEGLVAWGESCPGKSEGAENAEEVISQLNKLIKVGIKDKSIYEIESIARDMKISPSAYAGLDIALWDLKAKKAKLPLNELLGLPLPKSMTSLTIGIMSPESVKQRIPLLFENASTKFLKVKLGSPLGLEADKAMYKQVLESTKGYGLSLRVDANGGWSTENAKYMIDWLSDKNCDYVEQPLVEGNEKELKTLYQSRSLPIFVDESCRSSSDISKYHDCVDGVNLKLMKCGGITEGLRVLSTDEGCSCRD